MPEKTLARLTALLLLLTLALPASSSLGKRPEHLLDSQRVEPITTGPFHQVFEARRGEVVLMNLRATWCILCSQELPDLELMQLLYKEMEEMTLELLYERADL